MATSTIKAILVFLIASQLSGCISAYYLITAPFESIKRSKPDLYYSFAITVNSDEIQRTFKGSILCKHRIGFNAGTGWWDSYHTEVTDIAYSDLEDDNVSWQIYGITCPNPLPTMSGIFRKSPDGNIKVLSRLDNDTKTFSNKWEFGEHPKYPPLMSATKIFENQHYPATQYVYWIMKLSETPEALSKIHEISILSFDGNPECTGTTQRVAVGNIRALFSPKNGEYMRRGFLEYSTETSAWILSEPRAGNHFVDVARKNFSGKYIPGNNCPTFSYKGMHVLSDRGGEAIYDPDEKILIMIDGNHPSYVTRNMYLDSIHECSSKIPLETLESLDLYPDYHEVRRTWSEKVNGHDGKQYTALHQSVLLKVDGKVKCIKWPQEALYGRGW